MFKTKDENAGRYLGYDDIKGFLEKFEKCKIEEGKSAQGRNIPLFRFGKAEKKVLMWSQMHGNETTTTKALLNLLEEFEKNRWKNISILVIAMLNPDGAEKYTRENSLGIDLNRDAKDLSQVESKFLRKIVRDYKPNYCFNLHDQRSIFGVGNPAQPATISFLAPAYDQEKSVNQTRKIAMEIVVAMKEKLSQTIDLKIGRFDDSFNINCTGDLFTSMKIPTILFEAGHFPMDYKRNKVKDYVAQAIEAGLDYIDKGDVSGENYKAYFLIPQNKKIFCDLLVQDDINHRENFAIVFKEELKGKEVVFYPVMDKKTTENEVEGHNRVKLSEICEGHLNTCAKTEELVMDWARKNINKFI